MKDEHFNELLDSVKEAGRIMRGETKPARTHEFPEPDVKNIARLNQAVVGDKAGSGGAA